MQIQIKDRPARVPTRLLTALLLGLSILLTSCVTKRTVTGSKGNVIKDDYIIKRPVRDALNSAER